MNEKLRFKMEIDNRRKIVEHFFLFGLFLLAASLPYSKFLMSLAQVILLVSWILEGGVKAKFNRFLKNKVALLLCSLFLLHIIGLLYTSDLQYGMEDVKKKIPLLLLPLLLSTYPVLSKKMLDRILGVFSLSVISATIICFFVLLGYSNKQIIDPQQASIFTSHIRFGLLISMTVFILGYFFAGSKSLAARIFFVLLIIWLISFLTMLESANALLCTATVFMILIIRALLRPGNIKTKLIFAAILLLASAMAIKSYHVVASEYVHDPSSSNQPLIAITEAGNPYYHDTLNKEIENGNYVWRNVCEAELEKTWNQRSKLNYSGKDRRGNEIKYTLIRFLTSKGLSKDEKGINALSPKEQQAIERGIPNINYVGFFNPMARLQKILWEFDLHMKGGNPSGHSVIQRFEFWKAAMGIIKENPLFGVGTGDVKNAFEAQYEKMNSPLTKEWRLRSHNQFLAIATALGLIGLTWFLITLFYLLLANRNYNNYLYLAFFIIAFLSMLSEDTLESQAGVTFFAFFNSLLLFLQKDKLPTH